MPDVLAVSCETRAAHLVFCRHCWLVWDEGERDKRRAGRLTLTCCTHLCTTQVCVLVFRDMIECMDLTLCRLDRLIHVQISGCPVLLWIE